MAEQVLERGDVLPIHKEWVENDRPQTECGIIGIADWQSTTVLRDTLTGLEQLQHRGEDGAGIAAMSYTDSYPHYLRGKGKVTEVFGPNGEGLALLPQDAHIAIGQTRYATNKADDGIQPRENLAHNGNLTNIPALAKKYGLESYTTDSDGAGKLIKHLAHTMFKSDIERSVLFLLPQFEGAFCFVIQTPDKLIAARDRYGFRPLQLGRTKSGGFIVTSEVKAIDHIEGATWEREIEAGEMLVIEKDKPEPRSGIWAEPKLSTCALEFVYLSNHKNIINGIKVEEFRLETGRKLGRMATLPFAKRILQGFGAGKEITLPVPESGIFAAKGFSETSFIRIIKALTKNKGAGRSFIQADDIARIEVAGSKQMLEEELVEDKDNFMVDDSAVRGHSTRANAGKVRVAQDAYYDKAIARGGVRATITRMRGRRLIHLKVASPPITDTCEYGVDIGNPQELLAVRAGGDRQKMAEELGVDSVTFLTIGDLQSAAGRTLCTKCMGGPKPDAVAHALRTTREVIEETVVGKKAEQRRELVSVS